MKKELPDVTTVFGKAVEIADPGERCAYVHAACGGDAELLSEVASLLEAHEQEENFLNTNSAPPVQLIDRGERGCCSGCWV